MTIGILFLFPMLFYLWLVLRWTATICPPETPAELSSKLMVSVVVPFRNEGRLTTDLLDALQRQSVPKLAEVEFLFVNDHSSDEGAEELVAAINGRGVNARIISADGRGKKAAQTTGIVNARGQLILTLDADVVPHPKWLETLIRIHFTHNWSYTSATVIPEASTSLLGKLFSLEFVSLQAATEGSFNLGHPFMSNGANSAFNIEAWEDARAVRNDYRLASGDDVFLVQALQQLGKPIGHAAHREAVVYTKMPDAWGAILRQRTRWAAKTTHYTSRFAQLVAVTVVLLAVFQIIGWWFSPYLCAVVWLSKTWVDMRILRAMSKKYSIDIPWRYMLGLAFIYPMYTLLVVVLTLFQPFAKQPNKQWK